MPIARRRTQLRSPVPTSRLLGCGGAANSSQLRRNDEHPMAKKGSGKKTKAKRTARTKPARAAAKKKDPRKRSAVGKKSARKAAQKSERAGGSSGRDARPEDDLRHAATRFASQRLLR